MNNFNVHYSYRDVPTLNRFRIDRRRNRLIVGPFRSGKSSCCTMEIYRKACEQAPDSRGRRRTRWAVVRNTYPELRDTTIKTVLDWFPPEYFGSYRSNPTPEYQIQQKLSDGTVVECELLFRALDRPDHVKNLLSLEVTGAWFNEAREIEKIIVDTMDGRINQYPSQKDGGATWGGTFLDTNPCDTDHWLYKLYVEKLPNSPELQEFYGYYHQPSGLSAEAENLTHLSRNYYQNLAVGKDDNFIKVYIHGQYGYVREGKIIYTNYNDLDHCALVPLEPWRGVHLTLGWDFGLCYSDDTEVLTKDGWKFFKDVDENVDLVATRNPDSGTMEYTKINFKIERDYEGELLEWSNRNINFCVTPEHRIPMTFRDSPKRIHFKSAEWLAQHPGGHHYVDLVSDWNVLPTGKKYLAGMGAREYSRFMGIYLAEGSADKWRTTIYQKERDFRIQEILSSTGLPWKWNGHDVSSGWRLSNFFIARKLKELGTAKNKRVPPEIKEMPSEFIRAFIDAYTIGDGHIRTRENGAVEHTIFTISKNMADDLQELAQKVGWSASVRIVKPQDSIIVENGVPRRISNDGGFCITFKKRAKRAELLKEDFRRIIYSGKIYCLNVPYHTLYIRRNNIASWNGNTPACVVTQFHPRGNLHVLREICATEMGVKRLARDVVRPYLIANFNGYRYVSGCDPSGAKRSEIDETKSCYKELKESGFPVKLAFSNNLEPRFTSVDNFLLKGKIEGKPAFQIDPSCTLLRKGFNGEYKRRKLNVVGSEVYADAPEKNAVSHPHEALQYACMTIERGIAPDRTVSGRGYRQPQTPPPVKAYY
jgi:hypothetical protein